MEGGEGVKERGRVEEEIKKGVDEHKRVPILDQEDQEQARIARRRKAEQDLLAAGWNYAQQSHFEEGDFYTEAEIIEPEGLDCDNWEIHGDVVPPKGSWLWRKVHLKGGGVNFEVSHGNEQYLSPYHNDLLQKSLLI